MTDSAHRVRRLLKALLSLEFEGPPGHLLIAAISTLRVLYDKRARHLAQSIDGTFSPIWSAVIEGSDRARALRGFETAILFELRKALRNGSIWVPHSMSYRHREQLLITSRQWRRGKKRYYAHLNLPADPERYVARYKQQLDEGLEQVAEAVFSNHIDIEKDQLVMEALERIAVDTHGFTFFGMGLSKGLGFDLCPRLRGIKRQLHVPRGARVPDILDPVVTRDVSMVNIRAGWDGFVRLMASVDAATLSAVLALDRFGSESRADPIHKCGSAMGQLFLTIFLCDFVGKDDFRRELLRILDRGESTHRQ